MKRIQAFRTRTLQLTLNTAIYAIVNVSQNVSTILNFLVQNKIDLLVIGNSFIKKMISLC